MAAKLSLPMVTFECCMLTVQPNMVKIPPSDQMSKQQPTDHSKSSLIKSEPAHEPHSTDMDVPRPSLVGRQGRAVEGDEVHVHPPVHLSRVEYVIYEN